MHGRTLGIMSVYESCEMAPAVLNIDLDKKTSTAMTNADEYVL